MLPFKLRTSSRTATLITSYHSQPPWPFITLTLDVCTRQCEILTDGIPVRNVAHWKLWKYGGYNCLIVFLMCVGSLASPESLVTTRTQRGSYCKAGRLGC